MQLSLARRCFIREIRQSDEAINLERAALYLALEEHPTLDVDIALAQLDRMADVVRDRLPETRYPLRVIKVINHYLYEELGFVGNRQDYYDPQNSHLNQVLERRLGIPITMALVYLAIAKRVNFPMIGIGMPGHFLIRPLVEDMDIYVDAFNGGEILFPQDCEALLQKLYQEPVALRPEFLQPVTNRQFLARMLGNLKGIAINQNNIQAALAAVERILLLFPEAAGELRDRGILYFQLRRWSEARQDLEGYLRTMPPEGDRNLIQDLLQQISRQSPA
jgi:regulator of sirC expression with transglutaminase-like and TPR domain